MNDVSHEKTAPSPGTLRLSADSNKLVVVDPDGVREEVATSPGTAAFVNFGTAEGDVPVLGADGKLPSSVIPDTLEIESLVLADASTVEGPVGMLAYKGTYIARHDGVTPGGVPLFRRVAGTTKVTVTGSKDGAAKRVFPIKLFADELLGAGMDQFNLLITGRVSHVVNGNVDFTNYIHGFSWERCSEDVCDATDKGWAYGTLHQQVGTAKKLVSQHLEIGLLAYLAPDSNTTVFGTESVSIVTGTQHIYADSGIWNPAVIYTNNSAIAGNGESTPSGVNTNLWYMVQIADAALEATVTAEINFIYDLNISVTPYVA